MDGDQYADPALDLVSGSTKFKLGLSVLIAIIIKAQQEAKLKMHVIKSSKMNLPV